MPIVGKAKVIFDSMVQHHGDDEGKRMFYATANKLNRRPEDWAKKAGLADVPGIHNIHGLGPVRVNARIGADPAASVAALTQAAAQARRAAAGNPAMTQSFAQRLAGEKGLGFSSAHIKPEMNTAPDHLQNPAIKGTTGAYGKTGCAEMGPWTIIDADTAAPVTVECKFDYGQGEMGFIGVDDGCYTIYVSDGAGRYTKTTHIFPEAMDALHTLPVNPDELGGGCGPMIAPMGDSDEGLHGENSVAVPGPVTGIPQEALIAAGKKETIPGGPGAGVPDEAVPAKPLENGAKIEAMEHTDAESPKDLEVGKEIAKDHLVEKGDAAAKEYSDDEAEKAEKKKPKIKAMEEQVEPKEKADPAEKKEDKKACFIAPYGG